MRGKSLKQTQIVFYILEKIRVEDVTRAVELYRLGTISEGYMKGGLTIPFIDINNNIRKL